MSDASEQTRLADRLSGPVANIVDKHRDHITNLLGASGTVTRTALANDQAIRTVAGYCYQFLPALVRMAVREPVFVDFIMNHRELVLSRLVTPPTATSP